MHAGADPGMTPAGGRRFFASGMKRRERKAFEEALTVEGLAEEIAILRVRIREASQEHSDDLRLLTHGISVLARTIAVQYRLSPKARDDLAANLAAALNSLGDQLLPAEGR